MAVVTTVAVTALSAGASIYMSARQAKKGADQAKEAKEAMEKYKRQKLENPYKDLRVSTMGADLAREEAARNYMSSVNALQSGGLTGLSVLPGLTANQNYLNRQIGVDLDRQFITNENQRAGGRAYVQNLQEQREIADLAGLGVQQWVGEQNKYTGLQNMAKSLPMFASSAAGAAGVIGRGIQGAVIRGQSNRFHDSMNNISGGVMLNGTNAMDGELLPWNSHSIGGGF